VAVVAEKRAFCEHADCAGEFFVRDMEEMSDGEGGRIYVCQNHLEHMQDQSGYCSMSCQLGYGCDQSC